MVTTITLVTICPHTKLLQYWLYFLWCIIYLHDLFIFSFLPSSFLLSFLRSFLPSFLSLSFLAFLQRMDFLGKGSDLSHSCNQHHSCRLIYFLTGSVCLLIRFTCFAQSPASLSSGNHHSLVLCIYKSVFILFCLLFDF